MIRILVDTNVILDFMLKRTDFDFARWLLIFSKMNDYELWVSSSQIADLHYIASNRGNRRHAERARAALLHLRKFVNVVSVGQREVDLALDSQWDDFEDSLVHQAAVSIGANVLVTRNLADFERSSIPAMTPEAFFTWMEERHGIYYTEMIRAR
ncbi:PIN domain-containing protein [Slackia heliotrinireducens]|uniref:PIN domain-containing protein n=1 Tax=Slackia heliotrinireducens TaxID=84110 RepID=UPI003315D10B